VSKKKTTSKAKSDGQEVVATDGAGGRSVPGAIAGALISPLVGAPRNTAGALDDLSSIAEGMTVLPELLKVLNRIETHIASLDEEVIIMRRAVEGLGTKVDELGGNIDHLGDGIKDVGAHVDRLEPHLIEMKASLQPFKRMTGRFNRSAAESRAELEDEAGD
jgi:hypothetical protein